MVEQGYNYFNSPIHSMTEFFETRIENIEKIIPLSVPLTNENKEKNLKKSKATFLVDSECEDSNQKTTGKIFNKYHGTCGFTTDKYSMLKTLIKQAKQKKGKYLDNKKR